MSLYNIEVFKKDFSFVSSCQLDSVAYEYDYLSLSGNKLQIPQAIAAEQGNYIRITGDDDSFLGIVEKVTDSDTLYTITYKPFLSLFDTNMYINRETLTSVSLEEWIESAVSNHFETSDDALQNLEGVSCQLRSRTMNASLDSESNIENLYELLKTALIRYDVVVEVSVDAAAKSIFVIIGKSFKEERMIEADLPNIISREITTTNQGRTAVNKLYVVNEKNEDEILTYYLTKEGTVKKEPVDSERITPVLFDTVYASAGEDEDFARIAYEKARTELITGYENLISITVLKNDHLVEPYHWNIGDTAKILKDGKEYQSILTGKKYTDQMVTLIFGSIRLELTKKIKKKDQKTLDRKVKDLEKRVGDKDTYSKAEIDKMFDIRGYRIVSVSRLPASIAANTVYLIQGEVTVN